MGREKMSAEEARKNHIRQSTEFNRVNDRIRLHMSKEEAQKIREFAASKGLTIQPLIIGIIRDYLGEENDG